MENTKIEKKDNKKKNNKLQKNEKSVMEFLTDTTTNMGSPERIVSAVSGGAMIAYGIKRKDWLGALLGVVGGAFAIRAATGHCQLYDALDLDTSEKSLYARGKEQAKTWLETTTEVTKSVTINKSAAELYKFWRDFENLPKFMNHLESVKVINQKKSEWKAKAPLGYEVTWEAQITQDTENELIAWRSIEGSQIPNTGKVEFKETKDRGTEVKVTIKYEPPAGKIGELAAKILTEEPNTQVAEDLRRFKSLMESGEIVKVEGQTSGRKEKVKKATA
jgi:uncharacterized membrane protein